MLRESSEPQMYREVAIGKAIFSESISLNRALNVARIYAQDITERKKATLERENLIAELGRKNAELERFTYTVSHDLKSPLITIKGFLGFLEENAKAGNLQQMDSDITRIRNAADKMQDLLGDLLELSRIGRIVNPPTRISFGELAREAVELVSGDISRRGVHVEIAPDLPDVSGDHARLLEVMQNLVENGVKFMGSQAEPRICIGVRYDREKAAFFVSDNGIGIDPKFQPKIFGLFEKLDRGTEGTGVGPCTREDGSSSITAAASG